MTKKELSTLIRNLGLDAAKNNDCLDISVTLLTLSTMIELNADFVFYELSKAIGAILNTTVNEARMKEMKGFADSIRKAQQN